MPTSPTREAGLMRLAWPLAWRSHSRSTARLPASRRRGAAPPEEGAGADRVHHPRRRGRSQGMPSSAGGGTCTADRFANGTGVTVDQNGLLQNVSVNSAPDTTVEELTTTIRNGQVGVTTVDQVREAGGDVVPSARDGNPYHCTMCDITPAQAEQLFIPTIPNPNK